MLFFYFLLENSATIINKNMNHNDIAGIYKAFQSTFLTEAKKGPGDQSLPGAKGGKKSAKGGFTGLGKKEKGPDKVKGILKPMEEPMQKSKSVKNVKNAKKTVKMAKESINMGMRNNLFDRLYEEVMDDDNAALGLETGEDFDAEGADMGDEGDEVTLTLPRDIAQQLYDALEGMLGGEEDMGENEGMDMGEDEGMKSPFPEGVEFQKAPDGVSKLTNRGSQKVGNLPTSSGGGDGKYTDEVGEDGDYGHALVNPKKGHGGKSDHGNMKVKARRPGAPGSHAFGN
jgi:hypothetical protein